MKKIGGGFPSTTGMVLNQRLSDALLPRLISGEILVKDAERFLKERGVG